MAQNTNTQSNTNTDAATDAGKARIALAANNIATAGLTDEQAIEAARWLGKGYAHASEKLRSAVRGHAPARFEKLHSLFESMAEVARATEQPQSATLAEVCDATGKRNGIAPATLRLQWGKAKGYLGDIDGTVDIDKTTGTVTVSAQ